MSDKRTCQHTHMVSFPALPSPNSPRSGKAVRHGSLVPALPRLPMSLTGHRPCGTASLSSGPIPISCLALIANHAGFPPSTRPGLFHLKDLCLLLASAPGLPREVLSHHSGLRQLLPLQRSFDPSSGPQTPLLFSPLSLSILEHRICVSVYFCSFSP